MSWQPKESPLPGDQWAQKAGQFVEWAEQQLWTTDQGKEALSWLHDRGLTDETVKAFRLGWNYQDWFPKRELWGLPTVLKDNGKPKKLFLPTGLVIPKMAGDQVVRVKIRRPNVPPKEKYILVPGSEIGPLTIPGGPACIVVESELDAILLHQEAGDLASMIALGSASIRPDQPAAAMLHRAETILVALDTDDAGVKAAWGWWHEHFPKAKRWPTIQGKDPSEARQNGLDLRAWVMAGLLPTREPESAQEGRQMSTESTRNANADELQPEHDDAQDERKEMVKCDYCLHLAGYRCTRGHRPDGIALLRACDDFQAMRETP